MTTTNVTTNAYWDAVRDLAAPDRVFGGLSVNTYDYLTDPSRPRLDRFELCGRYSWTITDPATVAFVAEHAGPMLVDPLAGSGWWASLLRREGVEVAAFDLNPPNGTDANHWHREFTHVPVARMDAVAAVKAAPSSATLLLSWPPYDQPIGGQVLRAYQGDRVIYLGEGLGGCCGDDDMFDQFEAEWVEIAEHRPVQFYGIHDWVTVYERRARG